MAKRIQQRAVIDGKVKWLSGETQQDIFDAYLQCVIDAGIVVLPGSIPNTALPPAENLFETHAWKWYNLYKVGKVGLRPLLTMRAISRNTFSPTLGRVIFAPSPLMMCRSS